MYSELRLASGRDVEATANHPFLTFDGWTPLEDLRSKSGSPYHVTFLSRSSAGLGWSEHRAWSPRPPDRRRLVVRKQPVHYTSNGRGEPGLCGDCRSGRVRHIATPGRSGTWWPYPTCLRLPPHHGRGKRNSCLVRRDSMGRFGRRSHEKFIPPKIFSLSQNQLGLFLRHLWATDGSVTVGKHGAARIYYGTTSERTGPGTADAAASVRNHRPYSMLSAMSMAIHNGPSTSRASRTSGSFLTRSACMAHGG